jgi:hypothetical protein
MFTKIGKVETEIIDTFIVIHSLGVPQKTQDISSV